VAVWARESIEVDYTKIVVFGQTGGEGPGVSAWKARGFASKMEICGRRC